MRTTEHYTNGAIDAPADAPTLASFARHVFGRVVPLGDVQPTVADIATFLTRGRYYREPSLCGYERGEPRSCWSNAYRIADVNLDVNYVQGWVLSPRSPVAIPHAWCVDRSGQLIELTWNVDHARGDEIYFGLPFDRFALAAIKITDPVHQWHNGFAAALRREAR